MTGQPAKLKFKQGDKVTSKVNGRRYRSPEILPTTGKTGEVVSFLAPFRTLPAEVVVKMDDTEDYACFYFNEISKEA